MPVIHFQISKWDAAIIWETAGGMVDFEATLGGVLVDVIDCPVHYRLFALANGQPQ